MTRGIMVAKVSVASALFSIDKPYSYLVAAGQEQAARVGRRVMVPFGRGNRKSEGFIVGLEQADEKPRLKAISHIFEDEAELGAEALSLALWMSRRYFCTFFEAANAQLPPGMWNKFEEVFAKGALPLEEALALVGSSERKRRILESVYASAKPMTLSAIEAHCGGPVKTHVRQLVSKGMLEAVQQFAKRIGDKSITMVSLNLPIEQARGQVGTGKLAEKRLEVLECLSQGGMLPEKELMYMTGVSESLLRRLERVGVLRYERVETFRRPRIFKHEHAPDPALSPPQREACDRLETMCDGTARAALLHGVTGSGKTAIYITLIRTMLERGQSAILLVPEIALTPQMVRQFCLHFKDEVAVMHSALTYAQRYDEYKRIKSGRARVVIGTRSAVFAPVQNLGILIVDEEQEHSYKSENAPRYHARDVAKYRCVKHNALLLLGSATPSVETYYAARAGRMAYVELAARYNQGPLPDVIVSDMRGALLDGDPSPIGRELSEELRLNLERGEQSILFLNRRGSSRMVVCVECGHAPQCDNCSVALIHHSKNNRLMCHHCGFSQPTPEICPHCGSAHMKFVGSGTQKIEEYLHEQFPAARVLRMDADTTTGRTTHEKLLDDFAAGRADILLGTQMVAKGLNFENVTLVGVLDADLSLYTGDYHAHERTFSLIAQVVGRAGRHAKPGRAVIQTFSPKNEIVQAGARQEYRRFFEYEIKMREALLAPPFADLFVFTVTGPNENEALRAALGLSATLAKAFAGDFSDIATQTLGPVAAPIARINKRFRYMLSFRAAESRRVRELIAAVIAAFYASPFKKTVSIHADINPYTI